MRYTSQMNDPEFWIVLHLFNDDTCHSRHISRPNDPEVMPGRCAMVSPTEYTEYPPMFTQPWHLQQLLTDCSCGDVTQQPVNRDGVLTAASQGRWSRMTSVLGYRPDPPMVWPTTILPFQNRAEASISYKPYISHAVRNDLDLIITSYDWIKALTCN